MNDANEKSTHIHQHILGEVGAELPNDITKEIASYLSEKENLLNLSMASSSAYCFFAADRKTRVFQPLIEDLEGKLNQAKNESARIFDDRDSAGHLKFSPCVVNSMCILTFFSIGCVATSFGMHAAGGSETRKLEIGSAALAVLTCFIACTLFLREILLPCKDVYLAEQKICNIQEKLAGLKSKEDKFNIDDLIIELDNFDEGAPETSKLIHKF